MLSVAPNKRVFWPDRIGPFKEDVTISIRPSKDPKLRVIRYEFGNLGQVPSGTPVTDIPQTALRLPKGRVLTICFQYDGSEAVDVNVVSSPAAAEVGASTRSDAIGDPSELNMKARSLLAYLHAWAIKVGGRPFSITPDDPDTLQSTGLDHEGYMRAASWLVRKG